MDKTLVQTLDVTGRMRRHPYQTMLVAVGVGYVLGGGLFTKLTLNALRLGARVGGLPMVQRELLCVAEAALNARAGQRS